MLTFFHNAMEGSWMGGGGGRGGGLGILEGFYVSSDSFHCTL